MIKSQARIADGGQSTIFAKSPHKPSLHVGKYRLWHEWYIRQMANANDNSIPAPNKTVRPIPNKIAANGRIAKVMIKNNEQNTRILRLAAITVRISFFDL
jgi:hypothetical protein